MRNSRQIDDFDRGVIIRMWAEGASAADIAPVIGRSRSAVLGFAGRNRDLCAHREEGGWYGSRGEQRTKSKRKRKPVSPPRGGMVSAIIRPRARSVVANPTKNELRAMLAEAAANTAALQS